MHDVNRSYPGCDPVGSFTRAFEVVCVAGAAILLAANSVRLVTTVGLRWWVPLLVVVAGFTADLVSGLVHWSADTWGRETMPLLGHRFLRPFRVHHVNPQDFLRRDFLDCNGDVAMLTAPLLGVALLIPLDGGWHDVAAVAVTAHAGWSLPTNQVHQWAHMPNPPAVVRWLQRQGVILSREAHQQHHVSPYAMNYCIATGWCNRWLTGRDAFRRLERLVTRCTGLRPRDDDQAFVEAHTTQPACGAAARPARGTARRTLQGLPRRLLRQPSPKTTRTRP